jgi:general secretion pathway protein K
MRADRVHQRALCQRAPGRRAGHKRRERGAALVMVLLAIVVLTVFLTDVQQQSASTLSSAVTSRERLKAEYHARSAINLSRLLLATEPTIRRAIAPMFALLKKGAKMPQIPVWEFSDGVLGAYNCPEKAAAFAQLAGVDIAGSENLGLGTGKGCFDVAIVDEDSKISVNAAARPDVISHLRVASQLTGLMANPQYNVLFEEKDPDGQVSDRRAICAAIIDWVDSDEELEACNPSSAEASSAGVEDNYYQTIGLPYFRKNAAFDSLEELRLVRGMSEDFWATFVDPDPSKPHKRVLTVWGSGKVNVNTANAQTLWSVTCAGAVPESPLCVETEQASQFIQLVTMAKAFTAGAPIFSSANDYIKTMKGGGPIGKALVEMGVTPVVFTSENEMKSIVGTKSKMFSIYAEGVIPSYKRETRVSIHTVVDFRTATDISKLDPTGLAGALTGADDRSKSSSSSSSSTDDATEAAMAAVLNNPAGNLVYWRVQ